ncbi:metallophosphoesterase family protein [Polyangium mundeleinium]|uniref:Metallophosphoesterase n=1 Tax=Polyangium mundeleinium TaxID=2995306 RepID=A0ABT5EY90_9BACT|nr:metallophosphoesterase [Polyangium mundeleinium]MDC0745780.1 metallophosphoesterase [Polyangium mundeleinium]
MTRIAQVTDLHLLEDRHDSRSGMERWRLRYLTFGRSPCARRRRERALDALVRARMTDADHVIITGDLTEDGVSAQFEALAEVLSESKLSPERVTLVPGNHDLYDDGRAFTRALEGPLRAYARTSRPGATTELRDVLIVPISTAVPLPVTRSSGLIEQGAVERLGKLAEDPHFAWKVVLSAQHHPPGKHVIAAWHWIDGLQAPEAMDALLARCERLHVAHGHAHRSENRSIRAGASPRVFGAEAVVDGETTVRLYRATHGRLVPETDVALAA